MSSLVWPVLRPSHDRRIISGSLVGEFVTRETGFSCRSPHVSIGFERRGRIVTGLSFYNWSGHDVEIAAAGREFPRSLLRFVFDYVVKQLGCRRATFRTRIDNEAAKLALSRLRARVEGRQRLFYGDCDALIFGLLSEDFPYGKQQ